MWLLLLTLNRIAPGPPAALPTAFGISIFAMHIITTMAHSTAAPHQGSQGSIKCFKSSSSDFLPVPFFFFFEIISILNWISGWMDGWMDGWIKSYKDVHQAAAVQRNANKRTSWELLRLLITHYRHSRQHIVYRFEPSILFFIACTLICSTMCPWREISTQKNGPVYWEYISLLHFPVLSFMQPWIIEPWEDIFTQSAENSK